MMKKLVALVVSLNFILCVNLLTPVNAQETETQNSISMEQAKQIALKQVKGKIVSARIEKDDGMVKYEIIIHAKAGRYEIEIDQATGKVLEVEKEGSGRHDRDDKGDHDDHDEPYDD